MRAIRFHQHGEPNSNIRLDQDVQVPSPAKGQIRIRVHACGINFADWALCRGLFASGLPRGIGCEVSGTVDQVGEEVEGVNVGDKVMGPTDYSNYESAGAADYAILHHWAKVPPSLDMGQAAALTMATETAFRSLKALNVQEGQTVMIHGAGTTVGFAAAQICLGRGLRVVATMGSSYASQLRGLGAQVTDYGEGMVDHVRGMVGEVDKVLDTAPAPDRLADLVELAGGKPGNVLTCSNCGPAAEKAGVLDSLKQTIPLQYDCLQEFVDLAAEGRYHIPIGGRYKLEEWKEALEKSQNGPGGKLLFMVGDQ